MLAILLGQGKTIKKYKYKPCIRRTYDLPEKFVIYKYRD
jgi:hypothetical protein